MGLVNSFNDWQVIGPSIGAFWTVYVRMNDYSKWQVPTWRYCSDIHNRNIVVRALYRKLEKKSKKPVHYPAVQLLLKQRFSQISTLCWLENFVVWTGICSQWVFFWRGLYILLYILWHRFIYTLMYVCAKANCNTMCQRRSDSDQGLSNRIERPCSDVKYKNSKKASKLIADTMWIVTLHLRYYCICSVFIPVH